MAGKQWLGICSFFLCDQEGVNDITHLENERIRSDHLGFSHSNLYSLRIVLKGFVL